MRERYKPVPQVLIVLSDGLSTDAVLANADEIVPPLTNGLRQAGFTVAIRCSCVTGGSRPRTVWVRP